MVASAADFNIDMVSMSEGDRLLAAAVSSGVVASGAVHGTTSVVVVTVVEVCSVIVVVGIKLRVQAVVVA